VVTLTRKLKLTHYRRCRFKLSHYPGIEGIRLDDEVERALNTRSIGNEPI